MSSKFRLRRPEIPESAITPAILNFLRRDPRIAWASRFNTGAHVVKTQNANGSISRRFIRYAFPGCSDILGQTVDGRFLAIEVKKQSGKLRTNQIAFIDRVNRFHGIGIVARSVEDVTLSLDAAFDKHTINSTRAP
jgi:hypothetical protein